MPPPQFAEERHVRILQRLRDEGRASVLELARAFEVSEHTIRRDLLDLQARGALRKTHGGAVALDTARLDFATRSTVLAEAKDAIGRAAAALIEPGQTVIIDAGSTSQGFARALSVRPLTVITNALDVAVLFDRDPQVQLILIGGTWQRAARAILGPAAREVLGSCRADWAVLGACSIDRAMGITVTDEDDAAIKRAMMAAAGRALVLADHSKQNTVSPYGVAPWSAVHTLASDKAWPEVAALGVRVLVAKRR